MATARTILSPVADSKTSAMEASQSGGWPMMHAMMAQQSPGGGRVTPSKMLQATTLSNGSLFVHVYIPWNRYVVPNISPNKEQLPTLRCPSALTFRC